MLLDISSASEVLPKKQKVKDGRSNWVFCMRDAWIQVMNANDKLKRGVAFITWIQSIIIKMTSIPFYSQFS